MTELNPIFIRAARSLYGEQWQSAIARDLEISDRQIRRIVAGTANAQPGMLIDLWRLMLERQMEMDKVINEIRVHGATQDMPDRPDEEEEQ